MARTSPAMTIWLRPRPALLNRLHDRTVLGVDEHDLAILDEKQVRLDLRDLFGNRRRHGIELDVGGNRRTDRHGSARGGRIDLRVLDDFLDGVALLLREID